MDYLSYTFERLWKHKCFTGTYHMPVSGIVRIAGHGPVFQSFLSTGSSPEPLFLAYRTHIKGTKIELFASVQQVFF